MRFADKFLSTCKINVVENKFKKPNIITEWHEWGDKPLPSYCNNRGGNVNLKLLLTNTISHQPLPQLQFCSTNSGRR
jgi:hypothetical protein